MSSPRNKGSFLTGSYRSQSVSQPIEPADVPNNEPEGKEDVPTSDSGKTKRSAIEMLEKNESYKICVIGPQVGKTSLVNRFLLGSYAENPKPTTAVQESKVELNFNNKDYIIEILDTSGDVNILTDIMVNPEKQTKMFEAADGYMCVYSITSQASYDSIDAFIQMIRAVKRQDRVPLLLVGTLADEADKREVSIAAGKEKAELFDCPILEVSAKTGQNVDLSFVELLKILEKERTHAAELERKIQERLKARGNRKSIRAAPIRPEDVLAQQMQEANITSNTRHTVGAPSTSNVTSASNQNTANPTPSPAKSSWTRVTKPGGTNTPPALSPRQNVVSVPAPLQPLNVSGDNTSQTTPAPSKVPPPPPPRTKDGRSGLSVSYDHSVHSRYTETDAESYDNNGNYEGEEYYGEWDGEEWGEEGAYYEDADELEDEQGYDNNAQLSFCYSPDNTTQQACASMNGMSSAYISIELQVDKTGQYFNSDFPLLLQDKVEQPLFADTVTEINKIWNKGNQLRTYVTVTAAAIMLTVILIAVIGFPSGHESESEHSHNSMGDSSGKYKLFGLLFIGIGAIAVIPIFNLQLLNWKMKKIEEYLTRENRFTYHALGVNWTFDRETCNLLIRVDGTENED